MIKSVSVKCRTLIMLSLTVLCALSLSVFDLNSLEMSVSNCNSVSLPVFGVLLVSAQDEEDDEFLEEDDYCLDCDPEFDDECYELCYAEEEDEFLEDDEFLEEDEEFLDGEEEFEEFGVSALGSGVVTPGSGVVTPFLLSRTVTIASGRDRKDDYNYCPHHGRRYRRQDDHDDYGKGRRHHRNERRNRGRRHGRKQERDSYGRDERNHHDGHGKRDGHHSSALSTADESLELPANAIPDSAVLVQQGGRQQGRRMRTPPTGQRGQQQRQRRNVDLDNGNYGNQAWLDGDLSELLGGTGGGNSRIDNENYGNQAWLFDRQQQRQQRPPTRGMAGMRPAAGMGMGRPMRRTTTTTRPTPSGGQQRGAQTQSVESAAQSAEPSQDTATVITVSTTTQP